MIGEKKFQLLPGIQVYIHEYSYNFYLLLKLLHISIQYIPVQAQQTSDPAVACKARAAVSRQHTPTGWSLASTRPPHLKVS